MRSATACALLGLALLLCLGRPALAANGIFYIAAEEMVWDYLPGGVNKCYRAPPNGNGTGITAADEHALWTTEGLGSRFKKAVYMQYSDNTFTAVVPKPKEWAHTGLLGPIMRTHVGETLTVVFKNKLSFAVNLEPSGLAPALTAGPNGDASVNFAPAVQPGDSVTYTWVVPEEAGPAAEEPAFKLWLYRSSVDITAHDSAGLLGGVLVGRPAAVQQFSASADLTPLSTAEADRDMILVTTVINENLSPFYAENLAGRSPTDLGFDGQERLAESLLKHTVNGYLYCSGAPFTMVQGERVRWHVATFGTEADLHNAHWHGNTFEQRGLRDDQLRLIPGIVETVLMTADNPGTWLFHCHVNDHLMAGMSALYDVNPADNRSQIEAAIRAQLTGLTRKYYVAAEEVFWDYAPLGGDRCGGTVQPWTEEQAVYAANGTNRIGSVYIKAQYVQYTDDTFTTPVLRAPEDAYLGLSGPIMRAEVGDTLEVVFLNRLRYAASMHPHGVRYSKSSEGSPYNDGTSGADTADDAVPPGGRHTYVWPVPETADPGPNGGSTRLWMYHSHANEISDTYAGLYGGIIIGKRGALDKATLKAKDVDREVVLYFSVINEDASLYLPDNALYFLGVEGHQAALLDKDDPQFSESNQKHVVNGYIYCNMPELVFKQGDQVRAYVMALGTEVDMHTINMERSVFRAPSGADTTAALAVLPGSMHTVDMTATVAGEAVFQCRVGDHIASGMRAVYTVKPTAGYQQPAPAPTAGGPGRYFIAAEEHDWDYAPTGINECTGTAFADDELKYTARVPGSTIGSLYRKAVYRQYTDDTFTQQVRQPAEQGILGPTISVEAGQAFEVVFRNKLSFVANIDFDGGLVPLHDEAAGAAVAQGATFKYSYIVPTSMAPGSKDLSTVGYAYTSSVDLVTHPNAGLVGLLLVATPGTLSAETGLQAGVDRVVPLLFNIQDENLSPLLAASMAAAGVKQAQVDKDTTAFHESNLMHSVNGYMYCNIPDVSAPLGKATRLIMLGMGSEADMHSPLYTGQVLRAGITASKAVELMPTVTKVVDVRPTSPGHWHFYCEVHDHQAAGMEGIMTSLV